MAIIKAFKGVRPSPQIAAEVASRPYDVMNVEEAKMEVENNPHSFLRVTRSEVEMPDDIDVHDQSVYEKAATKYQEFKQNNTLIQDTSENLYAYRQIRFGKSQVGLLCASSLDDYQNNIIKKHELTRPEKELDRTLHIKTIGAQTGKVFMTYKGVDEINTIMNGIVATTPTYDFVAEDGVQHTLWVIDQATTVQELINLFEEKVPSTYIADGHHRAASAWNACKDLQAQNPNHTGNESYNFFITVLFPAEQLEIIDYNRTVSDLNGLSDDEFLEKLNEKFVVEDKGAEVVKPKQLHEIGMYLNKKWYSLQCKPGSYSEDPIGILDAYILQKNVLSEILAIHDPRTDKRVDFVGGIRGMEELMKRVDNGSAKAAFSVYAVTLEQLITISDTGNIMPPKTTWFEPKLRDGLVVHEI